MLFDVADSAMSLFASTSPSYLILQSLDAANAYMSDGYGQRLAELSERVSALRARLSAGGYCLAGDEPLKLTIKAKRYGYRGYELADLLSERGFVCEVYDEDAIVMMFTPEIGEEEINVLGGVLLSIPKRAAIEAVPPPMPTPERAMTVREAMFSPSVELEVEKCEGRVLAAASVSCPPAIPIAVCGEIIDRKVINSLLYYGITRCRVCCAE
jgi:arginine/lysine/ornithine decarboxylase